MNWTSKRAIPILLAAATLLPIGALGWLAVRMLQQDRQMERQRAREALEYAGGRLALAMEGKLANIEEKLAQGRGIRFTPGGLEPGAGFSILYQPQPATIANLPDSVFAEAEALEYQRKDLAAAAKAYRRLADSACTRTAIGSFTQPGAAGSASRCWKTSCPRARASKCFFFWQPR